MNHETLAMRFLMLSLGVAACTSAAPEDADLTNSTSNTGSPSSVAGPSSTAAGAGTSPVATGSAGMVATASNVTTTTPKAGSGALGQAGSGTLVGAMAGASGSSSTGSGAAGSLGSAGQQASAGAAGDAANGGAGVSGDAGGSSIDPTTLDKFSFFAASFAGLQRLSGSDKGFGGDLRYGEADGLSGADKICSELAESSMEGAAAKGWRAFLSVKNGPDGGQVNAIDRIGEGPWYDRLGRVLAMNKSALLNTRPQGADPAIVNDFPNEDGVPNQTPDPSAGPVNNHHFLTGSDTSGKLYMGNSTCEDWTSSDSGSGRPRIGFSYPAGNRQHWISGQDEGGCGAGAVLVDRGGSDPSNPIVGSGGGYGGFYCFALMP